MDSSNPKPHLCHAALNFLQTFEVSLLEARPSRLHMSPSTLQKLLLASLSPCDAACIGAVEPIGVEELVVVWPAWLPGGWM